MEFNFDHTQLTEERKRNALTSLEEYRRSLQKLIKERGVSTDESSVLLPDDIFQLGSVKKLIQEKQYKPSLVIVVGIGGSNLGAQAVYEAMGGYSDHFLREKRSPQMIFIDTLDPQLLEKTERLISESLLEEILVCVISKSGRTTETAVNTDVVFQFLKASFGDQAKERVVVITDKDSELWQLSEKEGVERLSMPTKVGGRFSVFSTVGLFPLTLAGFNVERLLEGAVEMRNKVLNEDDDPASRSAISMTYHYEKGVRIHDTFIFSPRLETLGKWYRQLLGESIGKSSKNESRERVGITPTVSIGTTDLHSVGQLYFGGPDGERLTTFVHCSSCHKETISPKSLFSELVPETKDKSISKILNSLTAGTKEAYAEAGLPFIDVNFIEVSEYELGAFMQWKMLEVMFLAQLLNVNAFDQPDVERYKELSRDILKKE